jgi:DNA-binding MarR family transcriptional regulator
MKPEAGSVQRTTSGGEPLEEHLGLLLWRGNRLFVDLMIVELAQRGYDGLTRAGMNVFPVLDPDGTRLTTVSDRLGVQKQTLSRAIDDLEDRGYLRREADKLDARAKIIRLTTRGHALVQDGLAVKTQLEAACRTALSASELAIVYSGLRKIIETLEHRANVDIPREFR